MEYWITLATEDFLRRSSQHSKQLLENILENNKQQNDKSNNNRANESRTFKIYDLKSFFILWLGGIGVSVFVIILEIFGYLFCEK